MSSTSAPAAAAPSISGRGHRRRREPHVAADRDPLAAGTARRRRARSRTRSVLVELRRVEAADVVRLEDLRVEHRARMLSGPSFVSTLRRWSASSQPCCSSISSARPRSSPRSDPEVVRRRVTRFFDQVSHCVSTHGGIVEKFAGDAVLAAFGVAQAHEDDAERAVRAGLAMLEGGRGARARGPDRDRVGRGGRRHDRVDVRDRRGGEPGRAPPAGRRAGRDPRSGRPRGGSTLGRVELEDAGPVEVKGRARAARRRGACSARSTGRRRSAPPWSRR